LKAAEGLVLQITIYHDALRGGRRRLFPCGRKPPTMNLTTSIKLVEHLIHLVKTCMPTMNAATPANRNLPQPATRIRPTLSGQQLMVS
jgi:hypothetical protein